MPSVSVSRAVLDSLVSEARAHPHAECCGLLAGANQTITHVFPAPNALSSASAYEIAPEDLFRLFRDLRDARLEHLGIYHSHPHGDNAPSERDIELAFYPDSACFILSPLAGATRPVRAFRISDGQVTELEIKIAG